MEGHPLLKTPLKWFGDGVDLVMVLDGPIVSHVTTQYYPQYRTVCTTHFIKKTLDQKTISHLGQTKCIDTSFQMEYEDYPKSRRSCSYLSDTHTFSAKGNNVVLNHPLLSRFLNMLWLEGPPDLTSVVYAATTLFWVSGTVCILLKSHVPVLDELLSYGRLANSSLSPRLQLYTLKDSTVWRALYIFAFTFSVLTSYVVSKSDLALETPFPLTLFQIQTARRLFDCIVIHRFSATRRMPIHLFMAGWIYYVLAPLTLTLPLAPGFFEISPPMRVIIVSYQLHFKH